MKVLLDTQIFIWYISANQKLTNDHFMIIKDLDNEIYLSVISIWEATVKQQIGKISFPSLAPEYFLIQREKHKIKSLSLDENSIKNLLILPDIHRDPFDRMLICQAIENDFFLMTEDKFIKKYEKVKVI
jgi:PIN domain nuclease of toxin-antitoxin system